MIDDKIKAIKDDTTKERWNQYRKTFDVEHGEVPGVGECDYMIVYNYEDKVEYEKVYIIKLDGSYFFLTFEGSK